ncbi:peroxiredoxin-like family protein [Paenibacillus kobensis]|uniref:peroxiredoxin-like family protein n=1 Tax=Paenibacillus kobensis TaxID=59841 RepID=UPI000FDACFC5|nr:peroxiredoxin-like family protein [Paenibacillus kobensis]
MELNLKPQLDETKQLFMIRQPEEVQSALFRLIREQQQSGEVYGLQEGQQAPDFTLTSATGAEVRLFDQLSSGPVVLVFYRGAWCPYCNIQLRAYERILPEIQALGGQLIALCPQKPDHTLTQQEKEQLTFHVLSDTDGTAASSFEVLFEVPPYVQDIMLNKFKIDLTDYNATDRWILPIPSTFIIDQSGVTRSAYVNPDFMQRQEPQDILERLKNL